MRVTYLAHSGFVLEIEDVNIIFDFYQGEVRGLNREKELIVFASHNHYDHYDKKIFDFMDMVDHVKYVMSDDIPFLADYNERFRDEQTECSFISVSADREYDIVLRSGKSIHVTTYMSTDQGVAFLLEYEGKKIYHAGDLNLWLWAEESKEYNMQMKRDYFKQLDKLKGMHIDVAFLPLDGRQEEDAYGGMEAFLEYTDTSVAFPMHFWNDYSIIDRFIQKNLEKPFLKSICKIEYSGQVFDI